MSLFMSKCHFVGNLMSRLICANAKINAQADVSSKARGLNVDLSLHLHP